MHLKIKKNYKRHKTLFQFILFTIIGFGNKIFNKALITQNDSEYFFSAYTFSNPDLYSPGFIPINQAYLKVFYFTFYPICKLFTFPVALFIAKLIVFTLFAFVLLNLFKKLNIDWKPAAISIFIFNSMGQYLYAGEWMFDGLDPKTISYILIFSSFYFLTNFKYKKSFFCIGLSIPFHPLVGGWATIAYFAALLIHKKSNALKIISKNIIYWIISSSYGLYCIINELLFVEGLTNNFKELIINVRAPHHFKFSYFFTFDGKIYFIIAILLLSVIILKHTKHHIIKFIIFFNYIATFIFILGAASESTPFYNSITWYYPFRLGDTFLLFWGIVIITSLFYNYLKTYFYYFTLIFLILSMHTIFNNIPTLKNNLIPYKNINLINQITNISSYHQLKTIAYWIRLNTPLNSYILAPPIQTFKIHSMRNIVLDGKHLPYNKNESKIYLNKLLDYNFQSNKFMQGYKMWQQINTNFWRMPGSYLIELANKYKANYIVHNKKNKINLPILFETKDFAVFKLNEGEKIEKSK